MRTKMLGVLGVLLGILLLLNAANPSMAVSWGVDVGDQLYYEIKTLETKNGGHSYTDDNLGITIKQNGKSGSGVSNFTLTVLSVSETQVTANISSMGYLLEDSAVVGLILEEGMDPTDFMDSLPIILPPSTFVALSGIWNETFWNSSIPSALSQYLDGVTVDVEIGDYGTNEYRVFANVSIEYVTDVSGFPITITGNTLIEIIWNKALGALEKQTLEINGVFQEMLSSSDPIKLAVERDDVPTITAPVPGFEIVVIGMILSLVAISTLIKKQKPIKNL